MKEKRMHSPAYYKTSAILGFVAGGIFTPISLAMLFFALPIGLFFVAMTALLFWTAINSLKQAKAPAVQKVARVEVNTGENDPDVASWEPPYIEVPRVYQNCVRSYYYRDVKINGFVFPGVARAQQMAGAMVDFLVEENPVVEAPIVSVCLDGKTLGYVADTKRREMIRDWKKREEPMWAVVENMSDSPESLSILVAFYRDYDRLYPHTDYKLVGCGSTVCQDNLVAMSEWGEVSLEYNPDRGVYEVMSQSIYGEDCKIGVLSKASSEKILESEETYEILAFAHSIELSLDTTKYGAIIRVYFK